MQLSDFEFVLVVFGFVFVCLILAIEYTIQKASGERDIFAGWVIVKMLKRKKED